MKRLQHREILYDGTDGESLYGEKFHAYGNPFEVTKLFDKPFEKLKTEIDLADVVQIAAASHFPKGNSDFRKHFKEFENAENEPFLSPDKLPLYYEIRENLLYVFSFGELQPARYVFYCEGVWELKIVIAQALFRENKGDDLDDSDLKELLNHEDLNPYVFRAVWTVLTPHYKQQYLEFKASDEGSRYREWRNSHFPSVDFGNLPEILDGETIRKIAAYESEPSLRMVLTDALSHKQQTQLAQHNWGLREAEKANGRALASKEQMKAIKDWWDAYRANPDPQFFGNMGEPETVGQYIDKYGVDPRVGMTIEMKLRELHDKLIARDCSRFYIQGIGGPQSDEIEMLGKIDGEWAVYYTERGRKDDPIFTSPNEDKAIQFYYRHVVSLTHWHLVAFTRSREIFESFQNKLEREGIKTIRNDIPDHEHKNDYVYRLFVTNSDIFSARAILIAVPYRDPDLEKYDKTEIPRELIAEIESEAETAESIEYGDSENDPEDEFPQLENLKQLYEALIAKGCNRFFIESVGGPQRDDVFTLGFDDGQWKVEHYDRSITSDPIFASPYVKKAIAFYYGHITAMENRHLIAYTKSAAKAEKIRKRLEDSGVRTARDENAQYESADESMRSLFVSGEAVFRAREILGTIPIFDSDAFRETATHNLKSIGKNLRRIAWAMAFCALAEVILQAFTTTAFSIFGLGFIFFLFTYAYVKFRQDLRKPSLGVNEAGLFLNQQTLKNAFVPWGNIEKIERLGQSETAGFRVTFRDIGLLLKNQPWLLRSIAKSTLKMNPWLSVSRNETVGNLANIYRIAREYATSPFYGNPGIAFEKKSYTRLSDRMTKSHYREILAEALSEAESDYRNFPDNSLHESFYRQLYDIQKTVVEKQTPYNRDEASQRYPIATMAIRNYEADAPPHYLERLSDIVFGVSRYGGMRENENSRFEPRPNPKKPTSETRSVPEYCTEIATLLWNSDPQWRQFFVWCAQRYEQDQNETLTKLRQSFGGMGSFTDLVLFKNESVDLEEMQKLDVLRNGLYEAVTEEIIALRRKNTKTK